MRIALVRTPYLDIYGPDKIVLASNFPLGIAYLAAYLRQHGHQPFLFDPEAYGYSIKKLVSQLKKVNPDIIGLSCVTATFLNAKKIAARLRKKFDVPFLLGGPHASAVPELVIKNNPEFDIVVFGEGEETLKEIADRLEKGRSLKGCLGCYAQEKRKIIRNESRPFIEDVDQLPYPARDLLDTTRYCPNNQTSIGKRSLPMFSSRGCPFRCVFCAANKIMGRKFRPHSPEYVVNEMEHLIEIYKAEHIAFKDDTLTVNKERLLKICSLIKKRGIKIPWTAHATVSTVDESVIKAMRRAGCFCILFGIETGDSEVCKTMGKGITLEQARKAINLTHKYGIKTLTSYIFGLPGDTRKTVENTIDFACSVPSTISMFFILVPLPGSEVYPEFLEEHETDNIDWQYFAHSSTKPLVGIEDMSEKEMLDLVARAYRRFYGRPIQWWRMLRKINGWPELVSYMRGGFGLLRRLAVITNPKK